MFDRVILRNTSLMISSDNDDDVTSSFPQRTRDALRGIFSEATAQNQSHLELLRRFEPPAKTHRGAYPTTCIKCGKPTARGAMYLKRTPVSTTTIGLGDGACIPCRIRYSEGNGHWECWQFVKRKKNFKSRDDDPPYELVRCSKKLTAENNYTCTQTHIDPDEYQVEISSYPSRDFYDDQRSFTVSANSPALPELLQHGDDAALRD